jgi:dTMP kinase
LRIKEEGGAQARRCRSLRAEVQGGLEPDLTLLLDAPLEVGTARIAGRVPDHFEREQRPFFERVRNAYLQLARESPQRIKVIDAAKPLAEVQRQIAAELDTLAAGLHS